VWAKISTSATAMACAACLATAATLPAIETAADKLAKKFSSAEVRLTVDLSQLDAFSAIPALLSGDLSSLDSLSAIPPYLALLGGGGPDALGGVDGVNAITTFFGTNGVFGSAGKGIDALLPDDTADPAQPGYAALSAIPVFVGSTGLLTTGNVDALSNYDALSAVPVFVGTNGVLNGGGVAALGNLDSVSAIPVFVDVATATTPQGAAAALGGYDALSAADTFFGDGPEGTGGVFTGGGLAALAPNADGNGGYAALSALAQLADPPAPLAAAREATVDPTTTSTPSGGQAGSGRQLVQAVRAALPNPAPQAAPQVEIDQTVTTPDNSGAANRNIIRNSKKFTPESIGKSPILFGTGTPGVDNGIRGWGAALNKLGIGGGGDSSGSGDSEGAK
jgi:hypothetical protein